MPFHIRPEHHTAIEIIHMLSHKNTGYCDTAIRFGLVRYSHHGSVYVELNAKDILHYTSTCAEGKHLLETFFGPNTDRDSKGYFRWSFRIVTKSRDQVQAKLKHIYDELSRAQAA